MDKNKGDHDTTIVMMSYGAVAKQFNQSDFLGTKTGWRADGFVEEVRRRPCFVAQVHRAADVIV